MLRNSSTSYHILRGEEYGFEFELAQSLAERLGVQLQVILPEPQYSLQSQLNMGRADLVAVPMVSERGGSAPVAYTRAYDDVDLVVVVNDDLSDQVTSIEDLSGLKVATRRWSNEERALRELRSRGVDVSTVVMGTDVSTEQILQMVADGDVPAAVAQGNILQAVVKILPQLHAAFALGESRRVHWAARTNSPELLAAVDDFLQNLSEEQSDHTFVHSQLYGVLHKKYFSDTELIVSRQEDPFHFTRTGRLSPYDDLFRAAGHRYGIDWRLLASLAFQESRFDPQAKSWANAVGLMQVKPTTAGVSEKKLYQAELNVDLGARHLRSLYDAYEFLPEKQRWAFALGAYNAGQGHLDDARILSVMLGKDPNVWTGSVDASLLLLSRPEYHRQVRYGYVRGTETVGYVDQVLRRYDRFCQVIPYDEPEPLQITQNQSDSSLLD
jgi:membrane-bound lytic murein transglycosylase F